MNNKKYKDIDMNYIQHVSKACNFGVFHFEHLTVYVFSLFSRRFLEGNDVMFL